MRAVSCLVRRFWGYDEMCFFFVVPELRANVYQTAAQARTNKSFNSATPVFLYSQVLMVFNLFEIVFFFQCMRGGGSQF